MRWLSRHRRLISVLTLLLLFAPAGVMAAEAWSGKDGHQHMHHDSHAGITDTSQMDQAGHDRLLCSIVVPCEHGFCAGLAIAVVESRSAAFERVWGAAQPRSAHPATPESRSPPPRQLS